MPTTATARSPILVAIQPPSSAPIGSAIRKRSSRNAAWFWSLPSTPWPNNSTLTSVTISAAPADSEAPSAARNGRKCTPAGSISRVRANRSQTKNAMAATSAPISSGKPVAAAAPACRPGPGCTDPITASPSAIASSTPPTTSTFSGCVAAVVGGQAEVDHHHRDHRQRHVDPEHVLPVVEQPDHAMPYSGPSTLPSSWAAPMPPSTAARLRAAHRSAASASVTGSSAPLAAPWMTRPIDEHRQVGGQRGDHRADREAGQADLQQHLAAEPVGRPAQQRHRRDVAQQIPGDDRGDPLDLVHRDADVGHDVGHDRDDDIGVERAEQNRQAARADRDPAAPARCDRRWSAGSSDGGLGDGDRLVPLRQRHLHAVAGRGLQLGLHQLVIAVLLDPGRGRHRAGRR